VKPFPASAGHVANGKLGPESVPRYHADTLQSPPLIPLDVAERVLAVFGIAGPTPLFERRATADGMTSDGLHEVLASDSRFVFVIDWRAELFEELELIAAALAGLGVVLRVDFPDDEACKGWVECDGNRRALKYVPRDGDDFTDVIVAVQQLMPPAVEFRAGGDGQGDGWEFAVLRREEWSALEALDGSPVASMFRPLPEPPRGGGAGGAGTKAPEAGGGAGMVSRARRWLGWWRRR